MQTRNKTLCEEVILRHCLDIAYQAIKLQYTKVTQRSVSGIAILYFLCQFPSHLFAVMIKIYTTMKFYKLLDIATLVTTIVKDSRYE